MNKLVIILLTLGVGVTASAGTYTIRATQALPSPNPAYQNLALASAIDDCLTRGQYGLATYRAAANYRAVVVSQP